MANILPPGVFLTGEDCARVDGLLMRALVDAGRRDGGVPARVERIAADIHRMAVEFQADVLVSAGSGTAMDDSGSVTRVSVVTERLTVQEVARIASVSESYVRRVVRRGDVRASRSGSRGEWLVDGGQAAAWVAERNQRKAA